MCKNNVTVMKMPDGYCDYRTRRTADIDSCIAPQIQALWDAGIDTEASCCGHDKEPPSLFIANGYDEVGIGVVVDILKSCDDRQWSILQWHIKEVASTKPKRCETCSCAGEVHAIPVPAGTTFAVECCVEGGQHPFIRRGADCPFPEKYRPISPRKSHDKYAGRPDHESAGWQPK